MELLRHQHLDKCVARYQHITDCILEAAHDRGLEGRGIITADDLQAALSKYVATHHLYFDSHPLCCAVLCCAVLCCAGGQFIINGSDHDNNSVFDTGNGRAKGNVQVTFDILTRLLVASP